MRKLRGIELRYVLTLHLALHGPATVTELVDALEFHGFCVARPAPKSVSDALRWERRRGRVRRLRRALYGPARYRGAPNTGFINACWHCGPKRIAQRRAHRLVVMRGCSTVLADDSSALYGCRRSTKDRRSPSNRSKVREFPATHAGGRGRPSLATRRRHLHAPTASCVGAFVFFQAQNPCRPRTQGGMHGPG